MSQAFERFWKAIQGEGFSRFDRLPALLQYLKMCVRSVVIDDIRKRRRDEFLLDLPASNQADPDRHGDPEARFDVKETRTAIWEYIETALKNEAEHIVIYENFALGLKPRAKFDRHSDIFDEVGDVYRVKQNVLARFRRDAKLMGMLGLDN